MNEKKIREYFSSEEYKQLSRFDDNEKLFASLCK